MQDLFELSFAKLIKLSEDLVEVIIDEGVEVNLRMVEEYHQWLIHNLEAPCMMLVNKLNRYFYTFEAQMKIADIPEVKAVAVVTYNRVSAEASNVVMNMPRKNRVNIRRFDDRESAFRWLEQQRNIPSPDPVLRSVC